MRMYIANASRQIHEFQYRLPENPQVRVQTIPIGGQVQISGDITVKDVEAIVQQHEKYGLISVDEINTTKSLSTLFFQLDKPIHPTKIEQLARHNLEVLEDRGKDQRKNAAVVMATNLGQQVRESGLDVDLGEVEVDIDEEDNARSRDRRASTGEKRFGEKTIVQREDRQNRGRGRNKR